jgi:uncharacterized membrane protein YdjX (TVP38/TMEM64 family)
MGLGAVRTWTRITLLIAALVVVVVLARAAGGPLVHGVALLGTGQLAQFQHYLRSFGAWAPVVSILLMIVESLAIPVPVTILMVANGLVFGFWRGVLVSFTGGLAGGLAAYMVGHKLGGAIVERWLPMASLHAAQRLMLKYGRWAVVLERWIPGIPGDPMSYVAGLTRMPVGSFVLMTTIGLLPASFITAYAGEQVADDVPLRYWLSGIALVVGIWIAIKIVRRRRAVEQPLDERP